MWPFQRKRRRSRIDPDHPHVLIIGNGITGVTAALQIRKNQPTWKITIISGESQYFYSRPALMYLFMGHMRWNDLKPYSDDKWAQQEIELIHKWVLSINPEQKNVALDDGRTIRFDKLLLATGSQPNRFGWPGQSLKQVQGLYCLQDLEKLETNLSSVQKAVIVGGGLIGVELAEMLHSRNRHVVILCRERHYWDNVLPTEEAQLVTKVIQEHGIDVRLSSELQRILGDTNNNVTGVELKDSEEIVCQFVGLTAGVSPNIDLIKPTNIAHERGILVDNSFRSSVKNVFAADRAKARCELAAKFGASTFLFESGSELEAAMTQTLPHGLDYCIEAGGSTESIELGFSLVNADSGKLLFASHPPAGQKITKQASVRATGLCDKLSENSFAEWTTTVDR